MHFSFLLDHFDLGRESRLCIKFITAQMSIYVKTCLLSLCFPLMTHSWQHCKPFSTAQMFEKYYAHESGGRKRKEKREKGEIGRQHREKMEKERQRTKERGKQETPSQHNMLP